MWSPRCPARLQAASLPCGSGHSSGRLRPHALCGNLGGRCGVQGPGRGTCTPARPSHVGRPSDAHASGPPNDGTRGPRGAAAASGENAVRGGQALREPRAAAESGCYAERPHHGEHAAKTPPGKRGARTRGESLSSVCARRTASGDSPAFRRRRRPLALDDGQRVPAGAVRALPHLPGGRAAGPDPDDAQAFLHLRPVGDRKCTLRRLRGPPGARRVWGRGALTARGRLAGAGSRLPEADRTSAAAWQSGCPASATSPACSSAAGDQDSSRSAASGTHRDAVPGDSFAVFFV